MENNTNKNFIKVMIGLIILFICVGVVSVYIYNSKDITPNTKSENKIEIGMPNYVEYKDIKTNELKRENKDSLYSQIKIKNISNQNLYNVYIDLEIQQANNIEEAIMPSYSIQSIKPNESAILTCEHNNIKKSENLKLISYSYTDKEGSTTTVDKQSKFTSPKEDNDIETITVGSYKDFKALDITKDIDKVDIKNIRTIKKDDKQYLQVDIKNSSKKELKNIRLNFKQLYKGDAIGDTLISEDKLKPQESKTLKIDYKDNVELKLTGYFYAIYDSEKKTTYTYDLFLDENLYNTYDYEDLSVSQKRQNIRLGINLIAILCFYILNNKVKKLKNLAISEGNEIYKYKAKKLNMIKYILLVMLFMLIMIFT